MLYKSTKVKVQLYGVQYDCLRPWTVPDLSSLACSVAQSDGSMSDPVQQMPLRPGRMLSVKYPSQDTGRCEVNSG